MKQHMRSLYRSPLKTSLTLLLLAAAAFLFLYNLSEFSVADREYREDLRKARRGIDLTKEEFIALDELISPLIRKGQPLSHILEEHREEIPVGERTLYSYIGKGYLSIKSLDMRRMVRYKKRKKREGVKVSPVKKINHHYKDFLKELEENPGIRVVEMDTVEGTKGGKVLQTIYWRKEDLMLSHINSTARPGLQGTTPLELALQHFGADTVEKLGLQIIKADDVCLKPQLLK